MSAGNGAALVTGASSGIGLELAKMLAADGYPLVLVARREQELRTLADQLARQHGVTAHVVVADLADPAAPVRVAQECERAGVEIGILVNNAGFGQRGSFVRLPLIRQLAQLQV